MLSPRNRELVGLLPSALLVTAGFTAIFIQAEGNSPGASTNLTLNHASSVSLTYGLIFLGLCVAGHLVIRFALPYADPYLFPLAAVLASDGVVMGYRIIPTLARPQAQWMVLGLALFAITIVALRGPRLAVLERYRYTIALFGIAVTFLPRLPGTEMWLLLGNSLRAMSLTLLSAAVALTAPVSTAMMSPPSRKRLPISHPGRGGRSSGI